jgi:hypothetical protein
MHWITLDRRKNLLAAGNKAGGCVLKSKIMRINPSAALSIPLHLASTSDTVLSPCFMQEIIVIINEVVSEGDDYQDKEEEKEVGG